MPQFLSDNAVELSTYIPVIIFTDENDNPVVPNAGLVWTLTRKIGGAVVNSRENVAIASGSSIEIVLSGNDLAIFTTHKTGGDDDRIVTVEGTFDSDAGSGLPIKDQAEFTIDRLDAVP